MENGQLVNGFSGDLRSNDQGSFGQERSEGDIEKEQSSAKKDDKVSGTAYPASFNSSKDEYGSQYSSYNSLEQARINAHLDRINHLGFEQVHPDVDDEMASEKKRLETFNQWPKNCPITPTDLAKAGFYFTGPGDLVSCFSCDLQLKGWVEGDDPLEEHKRLKPNCIFILEKEREKYAVTCHGEPVSSEIKSGNSPFSQLPTTRPFSDVNIHYKYEEQHYPSYDTSSISYGHFDPRFQTPYTSPYLSSINPSITSQKTGFPERYLQQQQAYTGHYGEQNPPVTKELSPYRSEQFASSASNNLPFYNPQPTYHGFPPMRFPSVTVQNCFSRQNQPLLLTPSQFSTARIRPSEPRAPRDGYPQEMESYSSATVTQESLPPTPGSYPYIPNQDIPVLHPISYQGPHVRTEDTLHITSPTDLQSEHHRMTTFVDWPENCPVRPWELASAGFYYLGNQDNVKCYKCGVALRNWEPQDTPWEEHKRWSSECPLVIAHYQGKHAYRPVEDQEQVPPRVPFSNQSKEHAYPNPPQPKRSQIEFQGRDQHRLKQAEVREALQQRYPPHSGTTGVQEPTRQSYASSHQGRTQDYPMSFYQEQENISSNAYNPQYPLQAPWRNVPQDSQSRNESRNPQMTRLPHDQAIPTSAAQTIAYNSVYSSRQTVSNPSQNPPSTQVPAPHDTSLENEDNLSTSDVMRAMEMGFTREAIDEAIAIKTQRTGNGFTNLGDLMQALLDNQNNTTTVQQTASTNTARSPFSNSEPQPEAIDRNERNVSQREQAQLNFALTHSVSYNQDQAPGPKQALKRSNSAPPGSSNNSILSESARELERTQEERLICKICMDAEVGIVFLPCGHISCCPNCASGLDLCPMCRMTIQNTHRTFLS